MGVRFDDGRTEVLTGEEVASDRLDHAYAVNVLDLRFRLQHLEVEPRQPGRGLGLAP